MKQYRSGMSAIAPRDARPTQEAYDLVVAERDSKIENINELQSIVTAKNSTIVELQKRPTAEQLSTAIAVKGTHVQLKRLTM